MSLCLSTCQLIIYCKTQTSIKSVCDTQCTAILNYPSLTLIHSYSSELYAIQNYNVTLSQYHISELTTFPPFM